MQPRPFHPGKTVFLLSVLIALFVWQHLVRRPPSGDPLVWQGSTMGTAFSIKIVDPPPGDQEQKDLADEVQRELEGFSLCLSTYLPDSEISRFNRHASTEPVTVGPLLMETAALALLMARETGGAFDPTMAPLVQAWGFGPAADAAPDMPAKEDLERLRRQTGYVYLEVVAPDRLVKKAPGLQLDLNAMAKGLGVDRVARLLGERGCRNYFVEIGGEVVTRGHNPDDVPWRIGVEAPVIDARQGESLHGVVHLSGLAMATSGNYRNYRRLDDGSLGAHILDPRTGRPVVRDLAGVSVVAPTCAEADALATALMVMGPEEGLAWVHGRDRVEALFVTRNPDGSFRDQFSKGFVEVTGYERRDEG